jgi:hypothetical protein
MDLTQSNVFLYPSEIFIEYYDTIVNSKRNESHEKFGKCYHTVEFLYYIYRGKTCSCELIPFISNLIQIHLFHESPN